MLRRIGHLAGPGSTKGSLIRFSAWLNAATSQVLVAQASISGCPHAISESAPSPVSLSPELAGFRPPKPRSVHNMGPISEATRCAADGLSASAHCFPRDQTFLPDSTILKSTNIYYETQRCFTSIAIDFISCISAIEGTVCLTAQNIVAWRGRMLPRLTDETFLCPLPCTPRTYLRRNGRSNHPSRLSYLDSSNPPPPTPPVVLTTHQQHPLSPTPNAFTIPSSPPSPLSHLTISWALPSETTCPDHHCHCH